MHIVSTPVRVVVIDDSFGSNWSHWAYSTPEFEIIYRARHDKSIYPSDVIQILSNQAVDVLAFSGKGAANAAQVLKDQVQFSKSSLTNFQRSTTVMRVQNTFLSKKFSPIKITYSELAANANTWLQTALAYPFDLLFIQTKGDADIINSVTGLKSATYVPFSYNDKIFFPRAGIQDIDVGMFFKTERHAHRIPLISKVQQICDRRGWIWRFSDQYWGQDYAKVICRAKILLHLSYDGDVPYRLFEAAGSNLCLLTDPLGYGIETLFSPGKDFIEYNRDFSDLEEKLEFVLQENHIRAQVANNAYSTATQKHTWKVRLNETILPLLRARIGNKLG